jgi:hypothetical protein
MTRQLAGRSQQSEWQPALAEINDALIPTSIVEELDLGRRPFFSHAAISRYRKHRRFPLASTSRLSERVGKYRVQTIVVVDRGFISWSWSGERDKEAYQRDRQS